MKRNIHQSGVTILEIKGLKYNMIVNLPIWELHSKNSFFRSSIGVIIDKPFNLYNQILKHKTI